jgi:acetylglutamate kinase
MTANGRIRGLRSAVPYLRLFKGTTFVLKLGGEVLGNPHALDGVADQVSLLHQVGIRVVMVHGGGSQASDLASRLGIPVETVAGRRITSDETLEVAKMVFAGKLNTDLLAALRRAHVPGVGLSGVDGDLIHARRRPRVEVTDPDSGDRREVDFGWVGDVESINPRLLEHLLSGGFVPAVCSLAGGDDGAVFNVNADTIAARLAVALGAVKLILLTSADGVLSDPDNPGSLISHMDRARLEELLAHGARGGMHAKLMACREALDGGVPRTHVISGLRDDSLLTEVFTNEGCGTLIENDPARAPEDAL